MRLFRFPAAAALLGAVLCLFAVAAPAADAPAPRTILEPADFKLADHAGKVAVVDFWASWCKPCGKSLPWLSQLAAAHQADGLVVVAVNLDEKLNDKARAMLAELDPAVIVVHDAAGALAEGFHLEGMPSALVYDRKGELRARHTGFLPADADAKEAEIVALLKEAAPDAH